MGEPREWSSRAGRERLAAAAVRAAQRSAAQRRAPCRDPPWRRRTSSPNFSSGGSPGAAGHVRRGAARGSAPFPCSPFPALPSPALPVLPSRPAAGTPLGSEGLRGVSGGSCGRTMGSYLFSCMLLSQGFSTERSRTVRCHKPSPAPDKLIYGII